MVFCKKSVLTNFAKFTRNSPLMKLQIYFIKKETPAQTFSCEFCEVSHNTFFKEPFERLLLPKQSFCLLSQHDLLYFQKRSHAYFRAEYFLGLINKLRARVNSIFKTLNQTPVFNPGEHLRRIFFF